MTKCLCATLLRAAVTSVLAIGGVGGLAMGLAGREICENLLNGLIVMSTVSYVLMSMLADASPRQRRSNASTTKVLSPHPRRTLSTLEMRCTSRTTAHLFKDW
eukprot:364743-Chlamydomonas_euryale.AAC.41